MRIKTVAVAAIAAVALAAAPAASSEHVRTAPPRAVLKANGVRQRGLLITYCWSYPQGDGGVGICADGTYGWPEAQRAEGGARAEITFKWEGKPTNLRLHSYRRLRNRAPVGRGRAIEYRLRPERDRGEIVAWTAYFRLPNRTGHLYLTASARWNHGGVGGDAYYTFHLKLE